MKKTNLRYLSKLLNYMIIIITLNIGYSYALENQLLRKPWLQSLESDKVVVMVETKYSNPPILYFKSKNDSNWKDVNSTFYFNTQNDTSFVHRFILDSLKYGMSYGYKVAGEEFVYKHPDFSTCVTITNMGDNRSGPKKWDKIVKYMDDRSPDFSIFNGDLAYKNDYKYWNNEFFTPNSSDFIASVPFYNATGNHEGWKINTKAFTQSKISEAENLPFYGVVFPNFKVLILNTEVNVQPNSPQWKYAKRFLSRNQDLWTIISFHIPAYSSGGHGENTNMKRMTSEIFEKYRVDLITNGHSHFYQRNKVNGITHLVVGSSGSPLYSPEKADYTLAQKKAYHYAVFEVCKSSFNVEVFDIEDNLIDEFQL